MARRKFYEARDSAPQKAGWVLLQIGHLYRIEARLKESRAGPKLRQAVRGAESRPIIERLHQALSRFTLSLRHLPKSAFGRAVDYVLSLWPMLQVYVQDGRVEIDNNPVENSIRPTAIGKKNYPSLRSVSAVWLRPWHAAVAAWQWLFMGDAEAGQRSAILYTLIESCRARSLDPWAYLRDVLTRLPAMTNKQVKDVTPKAWAENQKLKQRAS